MVKLFSVDRARDRARAIGHLEAGLKQRDVAVLFGVSQSTLSKLRLRDRDTLDVKNMPRRGRPCITTDRVDRSIRLVNLRNRRITARRLQMPYFRLHGRRVSVQTIRNRLYVFQLKSRKAAQKTLLTAGATIGFIDDQSCMRLTIGKIMPDPTSLLWAVYFVVIMILGHNM